MKNIWLLFVGILVVAINGCTGKSSDYELFQSQKEPVVEQAIPNQKVAYKILPQDRVSINIYKYPELMPTSMSEEGKGLLIDSEGYVHLPLVHRVKLAGLTQTEAARELEKKYKSYLTDPTLYLEVLNKRIYVFGEVNKPGVIDLDKEKLTMIEAIAFAGDFTDSAVKDSIIIMSKNNQGQMIMRKVDMTSFKSLSLANLIVKPNDIIYVRPNGWKTFKVASDNFTKPFEAIAKIASPFVTIKYLSD